MIEGAHEMRPIAKLAVGLEGAQTDRRSISHHDKLPPTNFDRGYGPNGCVTLAWDGEKKRGSR